MKKQVVLALQPRDGGSASRASLKIQSPEGSRHLHFHPQGRRHEEGGHHHLRGGCGRSISFRDAIIRTAAVLQLVLGNIGRAGGGMNALRGHSNIQGATDMAGIFDALPGYLKMPNPSGQGLPPPTRRASRLRRRSRRSGTRTTIGQTRRSLRCHSSRRCTATQPRRKTTGPSITCQRSTGKYSWGRAVGQHVQRSHQRTPYLWHERGDDRTELDQEYRCTEEGRLAGSGRIYPDETSDFWRSPGSQKRP